jgi:translation elongation factor EF-1beta
MKTLFRWLVRLTVTLILLFIVLIVVALLLKDVIAKNLAERNLRDSTGMDAKISKLEVGLSTPTLNLEGMKLYNTAEFGGGTFLEMPEMRVEYIPGDVRGGKLRFKTLRLHLSEVTIVKTKDGKTNLDVLDKEMKKKTARDKKKTDKDPVEFGGIDELYLTIEKLKVIDLGNPQNNRVINLGLKDEVGRNLKTEAEITGWFGLVVIKLMLMNPDTQDSLRSLIEGPKKPRRQRQPPVSQP